MVVVESENNNLTLTTDGEYENDQDAIDHLVENLKFMVQCLENPGKVTGELSQGKRLFVRHELVTDEKPKPTEDEHFPIEEAILA